MLTRNSVVVTLLLFMLTWNNTQAQDWGPDDCIGPYNDIWGGGEWNTAWDFPDLKQTKVTNLGVGPGGIGNYYMFFGMLEYLPDDYDPGNTSIKHPLIIFFHGGGSAGNGTEQHLCRLFKDRGGDKATHKSLPG